MRTAWAPRSSRPDLRTPASGLDRLQAGWLTGAGSPGESLATLSSVSGSSVSGSFRLVAIGGCGGLGHLAFEGATMRSSNGRQEFLAGLGHCLANILQGVTSIPPRLGGILARPLALRARTKRDGRPVFLMLFGPGGLPSFGGGLRPVLVGRSSRDVVADPGGVATLQPPDGQLADVDLVLGVEGVRREIRAPAGRGHDSRRRR